MSTYHQYSEIVAAYGNRMPPPQQQTPRLTLPFVYAAIGLVLGTFTGTAAGLISLQPGVDSVASHLSLANIRGTDFRIHPIANASQTPVIQNHANIQAVHPAELAPAAMQSAGASQAAPSASAQTMQDNASGSSQPAGQTAHLDKPSAIPGHVEERLAHANQAVAIPPIAPAVKPVVKLAAAVPSTAPLKAASRVASVDQVQTVTPVVSKPVVVAKLAVPAAAQTQTPDPPSAPLATYTLGLDSGVKAQLFYSEGDATVVGYTAAGDTIQTDDGRTFVVGTTVSVSSAASWDDYRANVHYRCDQNGHCTLTRSGVIALNAKLI
jgi:hypothetical protein